MDLNVALIYGSVRSERQGIKHSCPHHTLSKKELRDPAAIAAKDHEAFFG